jgi:hypothetical protein
VPLIPISAASDEQLKIYATNKGLTFADDIKRSALEKKVKAVTEGDEIDLPDIAPQDVKAQISQSMAKGQQIAAQGNSFVWVNIHTSEQEGGSEPIWVGCNGKGVWIPRGKWCRIRAGYFESLKNAVEEKYEMVKDPETGFQKLGHITRQAPRYPHSTWQGNTEPPKEQQYVPDEITGNIAQARPAA